MVLLLLSISSLSYLEISVPLHLNSALLPIYLFKLLLSVCLYNKGKLMFNLE